MFILSLLAIAAAAAGADLKVTADGQWQPPKSRTVLLTPAEMFGLAEQRQAAGELGFVANLYLALERDADPDVRAQARFRRAKLLLLANRNSEAATLLRRLLDEKPGATVARLELAHAMQLLGDTNGALRQLRAAQAAGLPPAVSRLVQRYGDALRSQRHFGASFEIAVAPNSNINRATRSDTLGTIFGDFDIDQGSKARSGTGLALSGQIYRRLPLGNSDHDVLFRASGLGDLYRHNQFNDLALDVAAGPEFRLGRSRVNLELGATQRWYGQRASVRSVRAGASLVRQIGGRTQLRLAGSAALIDNQLNDPQGGNSYSEQLGFEHALSSSVGVGINLSADRLAAKDAGYSTKGWKAGVLAWREVGRATVTAEVEIGRLGADERLALFPNKRSDHYSRLAIGATFRQLELRGFAPLFRLSVERNRSTIAFYDYRRTRTEFGLVRAF